VRSRVESRLADRVGDCFTSGEGIPFAEYGQEMVETIHSFSKAAYELFLPAVLLPAMPELAERLTAGGTILELGWGGGRYRSPAPSPPAPSPASTRTPSRSSWRAPVSKRRAWANTCTRRRCAAKISPAKTRLTSSTPRSPCTRWTTRASSSPTHAAP
jgi:hypothetical protein